MSTIFGTYDVGVVQMGTITETETDDANGNTGVSFTTFDSFYNTPSVVALNTLGYDATQSLGDPGVTWGGSPVEVSAVDATSDITQTINFSTTVSTGPNGAMLAAWGNVVADAVSQYGTVTAVMTITDATNTNDVLGTDTLHSQGGGDSGVLYPTAIAPDENVIVSISVTDTILANSTGTAEFAGFSSVSMGFVASSISIDKQISVDGGHTWLDVGNGNTADVAQAKVGCPVDYRVIVTNYGNVGADLLNASINDVNGPAFTFGGSSTFNLYASNTIGGSSSITSDIATTAAVANTNTDTATVTGTVNVGGPNVVMTASDVAQYTGVAASMAIDKQVSVNGGATWSDVSAGVLQGPSIAANGTVEYRVVITNTGTTAIDNLSVGDAPLQGTGAIPVFTFNTAEGSSTISPTVTLAAGGTITSDVVGVAAAPGYNEDQATVTANAVIQEGTSQSGAPVYTNSICNISASDVADYNGTVTNTPTGSITIDKQVSVDCGKTWQDVGVNKLQDPTASIGGMVEYRVIVVNTGTTALTNVSVGDVGGGAVTGFVFGTNDISTIPTLAAGATITSDAGLTPALSGHNLDTATVTGTVSGTTTNVTANDTADYTGVKGNITIDKQISTNGTTWYDVGSGNLQNVNVVMGGEIYYRVIVTDTGTSTISGVTVTDVGDGAPNGFTFGSNSSGNNCGAGGWGGNNNCGSGNVTITGGQSITSCVVGVTALCGTNTDTATVAGTITTGGGYCGGGGTTTVVGACDVASYTGVCGSLTITKYVSVNGGTTWQTYNASNPPQALMGGNVEFEVIVKNTGSIAISGLKVADAGKGAVAGFTFTTSDPTGTLAIGQSVTSDIATTTALCGCNTDTATATGTIALGTTGTALLTACSTANYNGVCGSVTIDKQVSVNGGCTWVDVGNCYNDPSITSGGTVDFRVIVTNNGGIGLTNLSVADVGNSITNFKFGNPGNTTIGSLAVGQSITSDISSISAVSGYHTDTADVTGTVSLNGVTSTVSAYDSADYTGTSGNSGGCGGGWGGSGGCGSSGNGWNNGCTTQSNGYGCGTPSGNLCGEYGQCQQIEFCYKPSDCVSSQGLQGGLAGCSGHDGCSSAFLVVTNCANPYQSGAQCYYEGNVSSGQEFNASCGSGSFGQELYVHCFSSSQAYYQGQPQCQQDSYCANGSQSVCLGDQVGCVTVTGYTGHSGSYCTH